MFNLFSYLSQRNKFFHRKINKQKEIKRVLWHKQDQNYKAVKYSTRLKDFVIDMNKNPIVIKDNYQPFRENSLLKSKLNLNLKNFRKSSLNSRANESLGNNNISNSKFIAKNEKQNESNIKLKRIKRISNSTKNFRFKAKNNVERILDNIRLQGLDQIQSSNFTNIINSSKNYRNLFENNNNQITKENKNKNEKEKEKEKEKQKLKEKEKEKELRFYKIFERDEYKKVSKLHFKSAIHLYLNDQSCINQNSKEPINNSSFYLPKSDENPSSMDYHILAKQGLRKCNFFRQKHYNSYIKMIPEQEHTTLLEETQ